jgi:hypothetical protein
MQDSIIPIVISKSKRLAVGFNNLAGFYQLGAYFHGFKYIRGHKGL